MCRVLAFVGPETPLKNLLLTPTNSLVNQSLDPERHPELQLAGWGFGAWSEHLLTGEQPFVYRRPTAAFYDDNLEGVVPGLRASTMLAHVRAAAYDAGVVLADENCHPFSFTGTPWIVAQNGYLPSWQLLQRELLQHCDDTYLSQMRGSTDTEFLYVLLLSLLEGDGDDDVQRAVEELVRVVAAAMESLDLPGLTKLKMALVTRDRVIGMNTGLGLRGETNPSGDWEALRESEPGSDDFSLSMLLEPMYLLMGRNFEKDETTYRFETSDEAEATGAIFASEALTDDTDGWSTLEFGQIVFLENDGERVTKSVRTLTV
ncbi:class II glutamine amidotransferase [Phycicoccus sp. BSK3Z-2]|uniref:Class II glutamine amidotransferase n=1 Tax=Phycicoccus avicenniae TaxID=2828860 RepID=A0A941D5H3_9MICO|nr:class II glutamine amidotransferase [Phycicoccus avicenniae]MBR7741991.1 class II glutamine amidotransferase [Phycicoccus avicenniae]